MTGGGSGKGVTTQCWGAILGYGSDKVGKHCSSPYLYLFGVNFCQGYRYTGERLWCVCVTDVREWSGQGRFNASPLGFARWTH